MLTRMAAGTKLWPCDLNFGTVLCHYPDRGDGSLRKGFDQWRKNETLPVPFVECTCWKKARIQLFYRSAWGAGEIMRIMWKILSYVSDDFVVWPFPWSFLLELFIFQHLIWFPWIQPAAHGFAVNTDVTNLCCPPLFLESDDVFGRFWKA